MEIIPRYIGQKRGGAPHHTTFKPIRPGFRACKQPHRLPGPIPAEHFTFPSLTSHQEVSWRMWPPPQVFFDWARAMGTQNRRNRYPFHWIGYVSDWRYWLLCEKQHFGSHWIFEREYLILIINKQQSLFRQRKIRTVIWVNKNDNYWNECRCNYMNHIFTIISTLGSYMSEIEMTVFTLSGYVTLDIGSSTTCLTILQHFRVMPRCVS